MTPHGNTSRPDPASASFDPLTAHWFDVVVLIERELTGRAARRMVELYNMKSTPLRYHLVRPVDQGKSEASPEEAKALLEKSLERLYALGATATGRISDLEAVDALTKVAETTQSQEVVVVTGRHRLASFLHRDLASKARERISLPLVHLAEQK